MLRILQIMIAARPIVRAIWRRLFVLLPLVLPVIAGCDVGAQREHVNALQKDVTRATRELVANEAEARRGITEAQKSIEQTRSTLTQQQTDIQSGLDRLESERKAIFSQRVTDRLLASSIESIGTVVACLVPMSLLGRLMLRFWQTDSVPEVDEILVSMVDQPQPPQFSTDEIWRNMKPVSIKDNRVLPETVDTWMEDT